MVRARSRSPCSQSAFMDDVEVFGRRSLLVHPASTLCTFPQREKRERAGLVVGWWRRHPELVEDRGRHSLVGRALATPEVQAGIEVVDMRTVARYPAPRQRGIYPSLHYG